MPSKPDPFSLAPPPLLAGLPKSPLNDSLAALEKRVAVIRNFHQRLVAAGLGRSYEAAHARLAAAYLATTITRLRMLAEGKLMRLAAEPQAAADKSYVDTTARLCDGLERAVDQYQKSDDPEKQRIWELWTQKGS